MIKNLKAIIAKIEKEEGATIEQLKERYTLDGLYYKSLRHVTTTNTAICAALNIPRTYGSAFKRLWEKRGLLVQSQSKQICPLSGHMGRVLTTNPDEYDRVKALNTTQANPYREKANYWNNLLNKKSQ